MSYFQMYKNYLDTIYDNAIKSGSNPIETLHIKGETYDHYIYEGLHIYRNSIGEIEVGEEPLYDGKKFDYDNKVMMTYSKTSAPDHEICCLEGYALNYHKLILIEYTKNTEPNPWIRFGDFMWLATGFKDDGNEYNWLHEENLADDMEIALKQGYKKVTSSSGFRSIYSKAFSLLDRVKELAQNPLQISNPSNTPSHKGLTILPSDIYNATSRDETNLTKSENPSTDTQNPNDPVV